jgi:hypothetical protein
MTYNRFAAFADNGGMPTSVEKFTPAVSRTAKPINRKPRRDDDDEDVIIPAAKRVDPFAKMLDRQALAYQAQFGGSYAQAYTKIYTDPSNRAIVDSARLTHLEMGEDAICGTRLSPISVQKSAPPDPKEDFVSRAIEDRGPSHRKLHQMALEHSAAHGLSYQQSYTQIFTSPENVALRAGIAAESGVRTLTLDEARALAPAPAFLAYGDIGDVDYKTPNVGREGRRPRGYAGG